MPANIPKVVLAKKTLVAAPSWVERGSDGLEFVATLESDGVVLEALSLRGRARKSLADREVVFQLEYHQAQIVGGPICRIEWRPVSAHCNRGLGPKDLRYVIQTGSHHHRFDLNWKWSQDAVRRGNLPIAVPINDDPENFRALLAVVGKEFNIKNIQLITVPPWQPLML